MPTAQAAAPAREFIYLGNLFKVIADSSDTQGRYAAMEVVSAPGSEPPLHIHANEDETFVVLEGSMRLTCAGEDRILNAGDAATVKRGTPHTFKVLTPTMRSLGIVRPGGFEDFFRELAGEERPSFERIAQTAAKYGTRLAI
ncbi:MAG: quercetin 2,3-dioxygenase [Acidobacteriaceae bacterium]|nr:quercetin 2,3-dioxygenase [Acidobacteriaceae bacterium]